MATPGDTVRAFCAAFAGQDIAALRPFLTMETVFENVPLSGDFHRTVGADTITARMRAKMDMCEEVDFRVLSLIEDGNVVFTERLDYFRFPKGMFPKSSTQEWKVCARWEVADHSIALWRDYYDIASNVEQLGVTVPEYLAILRRARAAKA